MAYIILFYLDDWRQRQCALIKIDLSAWTLKDTCGAFRPMMGGEATKGIGTFNLGTDARSRSRPAGTAPCGSFMTGVTRSSSTALPTGLLTRDVNEWRYESWRMRAAGDEEEEKDLDLGVSRRMGMVSPNFMTADSPVVGSRVRLHYMRQHYSPPAESKCWLKSITLQPTTF